MVGRESMMGGAGTAHTPQPPLPIMGEGCLIPPHRLKTAGCGEGLRGSLWEITCARTSDLTDWRHPGLRRAAGRDSQFWLSGPFLASGEEWAVFGMAGRERGSRLALRGGCGTGRSREGDVMFGGAEQELFMQNA